MFMLPDYITGQGNGQRYGGGMDSRNAGAYGDTQTERDRQTGLVKKSGDRDGGEPIKEKKKKKRGNDS